MQSTKLLVAMLSATALFGSSIAYGVTPPSSKLVVTSKDDGKGKGKGKGDDDKGKGKGDDDKGKGKGKDDDDKGKGEIGTCSKPSSNGGRPRGCPASR